MEEPMMMAARENSPVLNVPYLVVSIPIGMERNMPDITNMDISMPDSVLLAIARSETMFVNTGATLFIQMEPATIDISITTRTIPGDRLRESAAFVPMKNPPHIVMTAYYLSSGVG